MAENGIGEQTAQESEEVVASDVRDAGVAGSADAASPQCPVKRRCPMRALFAGVGRTGRFGRFERDRDGEAADGKADVVAGAVTLAITAALVVATYYSQYLLTKWAVKAALKETRLR